MSKKNKLVPFWHPVLHKKAKEVVFSDETNNLIQKMTSVLLESDGVGLAAPQIGYSKRIIIIKEEDGQIVPLLNPLIEEKSEEKITVKEGCLSISGVWCDVQRARKIKVKAEDIDGREISFDAEDIMSVILQHEIDHLDGKLFIDDFSFLTRVKLIFKHVFRKEKRPE